MWLIHHVSESPILSQGCLQKYNNNENIHIDDNNIKTLEIVRENGDKQMLIKFRDFHTA